MGKAPIQIRGRHLAMTPHFRYTESRNWGSSHPRLRSGAMHGSIMEPLHTLYTRCLSLLPFLVLPKYRSKNISFHKVITYISRHT